MTSNNINSITVHTLQGMLRGTFSPSPAKIVANNQKKSGFPGRKACALFLLLILMGNLFALFFLYQRYLICGSTPTVTAPATANAAQHSLESTSLPVRLKIPSIKVDTVIEPVGLTPEGAMDVPGDSNNAGWFERGTHPGSMGSAVIAGHFDGENGEKGVFDQLHTLQPGSTILVIDDTGASLAFTVRESRSYNPDEDTPEVFYRNDGRYLNLITCNGSWDNTQADYNQRLVVFATLTPSH